MSQARTLLEMAGAAATPSRLADAALVLIDCQMEYVSGGLVLPGVEPALKEAAKVLQKARNAGAPVIHVVHHGKPGGGLFDPTGAGPAIAPAVAPEDGEPVVIKALPNAFAGTDLAQKLEATGRKEIIVVGFMTHMCVSSTIRAATDLGYKCTAVASAAATRDLPDGQGGVVKAADLHRAELAALADRFATVAEDAGQIS